MPDLILANCSTCQKVIKLERNGVIWEWTHMSGPQDHPVHHRDRFDQVAEKLATALSMALVTIRCGGNTDLLVTQLRNVLVGTMAVLEAKEANDLPDIYAGTQDVLPDQIAGSAPDDASSLFLDDEGS